MFELSVKGGFYLDKEHKLFGVIVESFFELFL